jgi:hypothetical protein
MFDRHFGHDWSTLAEPGQEIRALVVFIERLGT